jgi:hypothetical protein
MNDFCSGYEATTRDLYRTDMAQLEKHAYNQPCPTCSRRKGCPMNRMRRHQVRKDQ